MTFLELGRTETTELGVEPTGVVDVVDEAWKIGGDVFEGLITAAEH
jgi:hypothetical protein